ncbi:hypothetical protein OTV1_139 [Ostreococcus tauri virus 1]|uniref:hypothetical protein n=1 Tax=Ostreococcus tauri virus 1 TaxID=642926 RepID=UPI0001B5F83D|nr:hypothetical protein OTV1_139 [Ostreococcus tauri virus 1]CAY39727.1 hypothetical protein OTV1_139 [Ostreococcus tauri virus 1]
MSTGAIVGAVVVMVCCSASSAAAMMMGGDDESNVGKVCTPQGTPDPNATYKYGANDACLMTCKTGYKKEDGACVEKTPAPEGVANVRYVRLERPTANYPNNIINLAEVEVFDENDVNVASGKTVTGGPGGAHGAGPFARLVDGSKATSNFAHTTGNGVSFMQIDLGAATTVKKIVITNRLNCCQGRTENMKVILLDASETVLKTTDVVNKGQKEMTMDFSATTPAWEYLPM